jgi:hypothetical protein
MEPRETLRNVTGLLIRKQKSPGTVRSQGFGVNRPWPPPALPSLPLSISIVGLLLIAVGAHSETVTVVRHGGTVR